MQILVTGATGFIGTHLTRHLLTEGEGVRAFVRSVEKAAPLAARGAELAVGDITDRDALCDAVEGVDVVYHLAGKLFASEVQADVYDRTHVRGTRVLLACCRARTNLKRFVHVSTTGVLGVTGDYPADEAAPAAPTNAYEQTKWEAEQLVNDAIERSLPAVIVRPGLVYGPGDLHLLGFFRTIERGLFRPIGRRSVYLHPIYIEDLVEALLRCATDSRAVGACLHIAGQEPVTLADLSKTIATALGTRSPRGIIPLPIARLAAAVGDLLPDRIRALAPLTGSRLDFLTHSRVYDVTRAEELLQFRAFTDLPTGIARTVAWYREQGYLRDGQKL